MAYQNGVKPVKKAAAGDAPNTGAPGFTPPPVERSRSFGRENYGSNAYDGRVVDDPKQRTTSPLADALESAQHAGSDGVTLADIRQRGVGKRVIADIDLASPQTRDVSKEQYPAVAGHKSRQSDEGSPGGTVPSHCGAAVDDSAERRADRLKG